MPALSQVLGVKDNPNLRLERKELKVPRPKPGLFVADWDDHGNLYIISIGQGQDWLPKLGERRVFHIGDKLAQLRHVNGIFAGHTGEPTLTTGSLKLNGEAVYYLVVVGSSARALFANPPVGAEVLIEED